MNYLTAPLMDGPSVQPDNALTGGQARRAWINSLADRLGEYIPPELRGGVNMLSMLNPVNDVGEAMQNSRVMMDGSRSGRERFDAGVDMATNMAAVLAPVVAGKMAGGADEAADVVDALLGFGGPTREAATDYATRFAADESGAIRLWHGSPHDFDKFSMDKIGTGEGVQAYGHGLYFAENEGIARSYRDALSRGIDDTGVSLRLDGRQVSDPTVDQIKVARFGVDSTLGGVQRQIDAAMRKLETASKADELGLGVSDYDLVQMDIDALTRRAQEIKGLAGRVEMAPAGRMYEVNINANPDDFLDWDAPLSEQSPKVREFLNPKYEARESEWPGSYDTFMQTPLGEARLSSYGNKDAANEFLEFVKSGKYPTEEVSRLVRDNPEAATALLREQGIPGIKYLDAGSRGAGDGSRNYVVFDDRLINVLGKDGDRYTPEGKAQSILDMLAEGRAGEVTDEMLDLGDPTLNARLNEYLFNNYDLPMDEASRMARAREMGLVDDQYHATPYDFSSFEPSQTGLSGRGVYTGDSADDVIPYAKVESSENLRVIPLKTPSDETYARKIDWQNTVDADQEFPWNATVDETVAGFKRASDHMLGQGYSGVHSQAGERVTFDPSNIRSRFARFDPRLSHLRNLSAGAAGLGILGGAMTPADEVDAWLNGEGM